MKKIYTSLLISIGIMVGSLAGTLMLSQNTLADTSCGTETAVISCGDEGGVWGLLIIVIRILTGGVFIAAIGGVVYGAMLYTSAGGSQEQTKKAKGVITNVAIGMITFALMSVLLEWLIPGGLLNGSGGELLAPEGSTLPGGGSGGGTFVPPQDGYNAI